MSAEPRLRALEAPLVALAAVALWHRLGGPGLLRDALVRELEEKRAELGELEQALEDFDRWSASDGGPP